MCKHFSFRIFPCFRSIVICHSLCKHFSIFICNTATQHTVRKKILTDIVRAVDNLFTFYHIKINQISHQYQKQCYKNISNSRQFFIGHLLLFFLTGSASFCLCFFRTPLSVWQALQLLIQIWKFVFSVIFFFQCLLPRLLLIHTVPE